MRILLLDDDSEFRSALFDLLRDDGHTVSAYGSIAEVPPFDQLPLIGALITDFELGNGEDGLGFARRFNASCPAVPVIMVTAHLSEHLTHAAAAMPYLSLLRKPLRYEELHELLHAAGADDPAA